MHYFLQVCKYLKIRRNAISKIQYYIYEVDYIYFIFKEGRNVAKRSKNCIFILILKAFM
jgi:hypothetical protein